MSKPNMHLTKAVLPWKEQLPGVPARIPFFEKTQFLKLGKKNILKVDFLAIWQPRKISLTQLLQLQAAIENFWSNFFSLIRFTRYKIESAEQIFS